MATTLARIAEEERYKNIFSLLQTQDEKNQFYSLQGVKAIKNLAADEKSAMNQFASSVMDDMQEIIEKSISVGSREASDQLHKLDELVERFKSSQLIDKKQYKILLKASKLGKGTLAQQIGARDEEYSKATALSDFTYSIGRALREVSDKKTTTGEKIGGLWQMGKKRLLGGEEKMFSKRGMFNVAKRMGGLAALVGGIVAENPALMLLGAHIQDKVNEGDKLISERENTEKERQAKLIEEEMKREDDLNEESESFEKASNDLEDAADSVAEAIADDSFEMDDSVFDNAIEDIDDMTEDLDEIREILTSMYEQDKTFYSEFLDIQKDKELGRTIESADLPIMPGIEVPGISKDDKAEAEQTGGFLATMMGGALGPALGKLMPALGAIAGPLLAVAAGGAIAMAIGPALNDAINDKFKDQGGLGGAIYNWIHGKEDKTSGTSEDPIIKALNQTPKEIEAQMENIKAELDAVEGVGDVFFSGMSEKDIAKASELRFKLKKLKEIQDGAWATGLKIPVPNDVPEKSATLEEIAKKAAEAHANLAPQRSMIEKTTNPTNIGVDNSTKVQNIANGAGENSSQTPKLSLMTGDKKSSVSVHSNSHIS